MKNALANKISFALAAAFCAFGIQGCYIDSNCIERVAYDCGYTCEEFCDTQEVCDFFECWYDTVCYDDCGEHCHSYTVCEEPPECWTDVDCRGGYCRGGFCEYVNAGPVDVPPSVDPGMSIDPGISGNNGNNSYCNSDVDCIENGSCDLSTHSCVLPKNNISECDTYKDCLEAGYRSNVDNAELNICVRYTDTSGNAANYCTIDCYVDSQCDSGYTCYLTENSLESGVCIRGKEMACTYDSECSDKGMVCSNGRCAVTCQTDSDCAAKGATFSCIRGACTFHN